MKLTEFWCDPVDLLTPHRFDILFKYMYIKYLRKGISEKWTDDVYGQHIRVWNGLNELNPTKSGLEEYKVVFHKILESIEKNGFDETLSYIPYHENSRSPLNGSHRISASIFFNKPVYCKYSPEIVNEPL